MPDQLTLKGFGLDKIFYLINSAINIGFDAFSTASKPKESGIQFPSYNKPPTPAPPDPPTQTEQDKGNQILLGIAGVTGLVVATIILTSQSKKAKRA